MVGTGRFELEPICGRERGKAERESAGEILSGAPAESKGRTPAPLASLYALVSNALRREAFGVLVWGARGRQQDLPI
jgi:hypothetical protein